MYVSLFCVYRAAGAFSDASVYVFTGLRFRGVDVRGNVPAVSEGAAVRERLAERSGPSCGVKRNNVGALGGTQGGCIRATLLRLHNTLQLTLMWRNQQIQSLLGEVGPDRHHLFPQLCVHLVLVNTTYAHSSITRMHIYTDTYAHI